MSNNLFQNKYRVPSIRAKWHDYNNGIYFITICVDYYDNHYFGEIISKPTGQEMVLSDLGKYTDLCIRKMESLHDDVTLSSYVIMPNHIHLILIIENFSGRNAVGNNVVGNNVVGDNILGDNILGDNETPRCDVSTGTPRCDVSTGVSLPKKITENEKMKGIANQCGRVSHIISRFKYAVTHYAHQNDIHFKWQSRFYDVIIQNQDSFNNITKYINNNIKKWDSDCFKTNNT